MSLYGVLVCEGFWGSKGRGQRTTCTCIVPVITPHFSIRFIKEACKGETAAVEYFVTLLSEVVWLGERHGRDVCSNRREAWERCVVQ